MSDENESEEQEISDDQNYPLDPSYYNNAEDDSFKLFIGQVNYIPLFLLLLLPSSPSSPSLLFISLLILILLDSKEFRRRKFENIF